MGADAALPKFSGAATEAALTLHNSEDSAPAVPTNSPRSFRRGLNIISTVRYSKTIFFFFIF